MIQGSYKRHFMQSLYDDICYSFSEKRGCILTVLAVLLTVGAAIFVTWNQHAFYQRAKETSGVVTRYVCTEDSDNNTQCTTTARYRLANGEMVSTDLSDSLDSDEIGKHIQILYDPEAPTRAQHGPANEGVLVATFIITLLITPTVLYALFYAAMIIYFVLRAIFFILWYVLKFSLKLIKDLVFP